MDDITFVYEIFNHSVLAVASCRCKTADPFTEEEDVGDYLVVVRPQ